MSKLIIMGLVIGIMCTSNYLVHSEEIVVTRTWLPGAAVEQEIRFSTTKKDYETTRDDILKRMKAGDQSAFVNPADGPWMQVETTATIGMEVKGIGTAEGRKHLRQVTASEEALFLYEQWRKGN